jgi:hypothetical protein
MMRERSRGVLLRERSRGVLFGITLPKQILDAVDGKRGDVPRSKYFQRLAEKDVGLVPIMTAINGAYQVDEK